MCKFHIFISECNFRFDGFTTSESSFFDKTFPWILVVRTTFCVWSWGYCFGSHQLFWHGDELSLSCAEYFYWNHGKLSTPWGTATALQCPLIIIFFYFKGRTNFLVPTLILTAPHGRKKTHHDCRRSILQPNKSEMWACATNAFTTSFFNDREKAVWRFSAWIHPWRGGESLLSLSWICSVSLPPKMCMSCFILYIVKVFKKPEAFSLSTAENNSDRRCSILMSSSDAILYDLTVVRYNSVSMSLSQTKSAFLNRRPASVDHQER